MINIKEKIVKRLPNIIATKSGFLKLNDDQKEALARRLELFFQMELSNAHQEGVIEERTHIAPISLN